jgi:predicted HicB family RNase H-like nuclease
MWERILCDMCDVNRKLTQITHFRTNMGKEPKAKDPKSGDVHSRVDPDVKDDLTTWAAAEGRTLSNYIRRVIEEHHAAKKQTSKRK